jgi:hypothetical protein
MPLQSDAPVRAAIDVDMDLTAAAHRKKLLAVNVETATAVIHQFGTCAKQLHLYPLSRNS